jgi:hypothetical protein
MKALDFDFGCFSVYDKYQIELFQWTNILCFMVTQTLRWSIHHTGDDPSKTVPKVMMKPLEIDLSKVHDDIKEILVCCLPFTVQRTALKLWTIPISVWWVWRTPRNALRSL